MLISRRAFHRKLVASALSSAATLAARRALADPLPSPRWGFRVRVVSGTRTGEVWTGAFGLAAVPTTGAAVPVDTFAFTYGGRHFTQADLAVRVRFAGGRPVELFGVGGPPTLRFGFSEGFDRAQFGRASEAFIARGRPYFGYLDPQTYVDGAGLVTFARQ